MMKKTMKKAMVAMMAALTLTGVAASTTTVFARIPQAVVRAPEKGYTVMVEEPYGSEEDGLKLCTGERVYICSYEMGGKDYYYVCPRNYPGHGYILKKDLLELD